MENEKQIALYYPYINITDVSLIKKSALYWDEIQTIVPEEREDYYKDNDISKEAFDAGFLRPKIVGSCHDVVGRTSEELALDLKDEKKKSNIVNYIKAENRKGPSGRPKHISIYFDKFDPTHLLHIATDLGQADIPLSPINNDQIMMPTPLFDTYMTRLATHISQQDGSVPLTNVSGMHNIMLDSFADYSQERKKNQAQLANLSLMTLLVNPEVPLVDILKFRDKHRQELINYRRQIHNLTRYICGEFDTTQKQTLFEEIVKDEIIPQIKEIEAKLISEENYFMIAHTVNTVVAIGTLILSGGQAWLSGFLQATASIGLNFYGNIRAEQNIKDSSYGYLYQAQKEFGTE